MFKLRDYQQRAVDEVRKSYSTGHRAPLLVLPTGGGKTIVFTYIARSTASKGKKVLILVHRVELLRQTAAKLRDFGVRTGLISPKFSPDFGAPVQVAMVQTMVRRAKLYKHFDLIVTDEAHHAVAGNYVKVLANYPMAYQLGVTATPIRTDGQGLGDVYDDLVIGPTVSDLIAGGYLVQPVIYAPKNELDLSGLRKTKKGDYSAKGLAERLDKPKITGSAVDYYRSLAHQSPGVAFCVSVQHAENVAAEFRAAGYRFYCVHGGMDDRTRTRILKGLGDGTIHGVSSCDVISEGTDIPAIAIAMMLRPTMSEGLYLQQVGRALRPCEGKDRAIILDHVGNVLRHGLPEEDREWTLEGKKKGKRDKKEQEENIKAQQCPECYAVHEKGPPACPQCGFVYPEDAQARKVDQVEGELQQLTANDKLRIQRQRRAQVAGARTREDLEKIARERGYKPGWVRHMMKARESKNT